jgi:hypothetical protein
MESERLSGERRTQALEEIAKDPLSVLVSNVSKGKSCFECLVFLKQTREELDKHIRNSEKTLTGVNLDFKKFYMSGDGTAEHHEGLFSLLQKAGFSRTDIEAALMENLPLGLRDDQKSSGADFSDQSGTVRAYLNLTRVALDKVFSAQST